MIIYFRNKNSIETQGKFFVKSEKKLKYKISNHAKSWRSVQKSEIVKVQKISIHAKLQISPIFSRNQNLLKYRNTSWTYSKILKKSKKDQSAKFQIMLTHGDLFRNQKLFRNTSWGKTKFL